MKFVDINGTIQRARRYLSRQHSVSEDDVKDGRKLADILREIGLRSQETEARIPPEPMEFEVDLEVGEQVLLQHNFNAPVRWYVTQYQTSESQYKQEDYQENSPIVRRATALNQPWNTAAVALASQGTRFRMKTVRPIIGVRFGHESTGGTPTITARVWNDSSGSSLASGTAVVGNTGVYTVFFDTPITTDLTGVDITCSYYTAATITTTNDVTWKTATIELNDNLRLVHCALTSNGGGDIRPTTVHGAAVSTICEPILAIEGNEISPKLSRSSDSTLNQLVLDSYSEGRAVIRVEPSQNSVTDASG